MMSGLLGVILKEALLPSGDQPVYTISELFGEVLMNGPSLGAAVLALLVFNMYGHLDVFKKLTMGVGWRSALVIGTLTGLFSDRIVAALGTIVGAPPS